MDEFWKSAAVGLLECVSTTRSPSPTAREMSTFASSFPHGQKWEVCRGWSTGCYQGKEIYATFQNPLITAEGYFRGQRVVSSILKEKKKKSLPQNLPWDSCVTPTNVLTDRRRQQAKWIRQTRARSRQQEFPSNSHVSPSPSFHQCKKYFRWLGVVQPQTPSINLTQDFS